MAGMALARPFKAMLHEEIFSATCNATNVAVQVAKTIARVTPHFRNLQVARKIAPCNMAFRIEKKKNTISMYSFYIKMVKSHTLKEFQIDTKQF